MKKCLTVLLVIAVMFTFSFGSAFAATTYYAADYANTLTTEMNNQLGYLTNTKAQVVNSFVYDADGFYNGYMKEAYEAAADEVIAQAKTAMETAVRNAVDAVPESGTANAPDVNVVRNVTVGTSTVGQIASNTYFMQQAIVAQTEVLAKAQEPLTKAFVQGKLDAVDLSQYATDSKDYTEDGKVADGTGTMTAADYVEFLIDTAKKEISDTSSSDKTAAQKTAAYNTTYNNFKTKFDTVRTLEDENIDDSEAIKDVNTAINVYLQRGGSVYDRLKLQDTNNDDVYEVANALKVAPFYDESAKTLFGVKFNDINKITKTEAAAINDAFYDAITASADVVKVYAGTDATKVTPLYADQTTFLKVLGNAMQVADRYQEVVDLGEDYKDTYKYGVKIYDDEAVDAAVKAAEKLVYADLLANSLKTAQQYFDQAVTNEKLDIYADNYELDAFKKAIKEASDKFKDRAVTYGSDKTPAEDLQYCKDQYATGALGKEKYDEIKADTLKALANAESYDDIDAAMNAASDALSELLKAEDATAVAKAKTSYKAALNNYMELRQSLVGTTDYARSTFEAARDAGYDLIDKATTVDAVEAAYADAQDIIDDVKTNDELDAMKKEITALINDLPYSSQITLADKDQIVSAYDAYMEYIETPGTTAPTNRTVLATALSKVMKLASDDLSDRIEAMEKDLAKVDNMGNDDQILAYLEYKEEVSALVEETDAFNVQLEEMAKEFTGVDTNKVTNTLEQKLGAANEKGFWDREVEAVATALVIAAKDGASVAEMQAALDAFEALTDRQQYTLDAHALQMVNVINDRVVASVEAIKITASSSATKGAMTIKWRVTGDTAGVDAFEIWRSTKKSSGFQKFFTTTDGTKRTYKNTKSLKAGTRYYYKVRGIAYDINGTKIYSDWSNKAYRIAK